MFSKLGSILFVQPVKGHVSLQDNSYKNLARASGVQTICNKKPEGRIEKIPNLYSFFIPMKLYQYFREWHTSATSIRNANHLQLHRTNGQDI